MSKLLISTALAGLVLSAGAAVAQPGDDHDNNNRGAGRAGQHQQADQHQQQAAPQQAAPQPAPQQAAPRPALTQAQSNNPPRTGGYRDFRDRANGGNPADSNRTNGGTAQPNNNQNNNQNNTVQRSQSNGSDGDRGRSNFRDNGNSGNRSGDNQRGFQDRGNDNRGLDRRDFNRPGQDFRGGAMRSRDFSSFHRNFNAPRRYRAPTYHRPSGWYSHHWVYGELLPSLFWGRSYWIDDYYDFGLMPPPPGTVWVRDGSDALLIDQYDGQIIQVAYDVFY